MYRIIKIGMDVHSKNYTLCAMEPVIGEEDRIFANIQVTTDYKNVPGLSDKKCEYCQCGTKKFVIFKFIS